MISVQHLYRGTKKSRYSENIYLIKWSNLHRKLQTTAIYVYLYLKFVKFETLIKTLNRGTQCCGCKQGEFASRVTLYTLTHTYDLLNHRIYLARVPSIRLPKHAMTCYKRILYYIMLYFNARKSKRHHKPKRIFDLLHFFPSLF